MTRTIPTKTTRVGALIPTQHYNALRQQARENDRTIAAEIRVALAESLKRNGRIV